MNDLSLAFGPPRVPPNAAHAFGGIWRFTARRFFTPGYWLTLIGMLFLLVIFSFPAAPNHAAAARGLIPWAGGFYVCFLVPVLAFISGAGAMRDDLSGAAVDYVFTRPVPRPLYVIFRYAAQMGCLQIDFLFGLGTVAALGAIHGVPQFASALPLLLLAQIMAVATFSAFGFFCGMITSRYIVIGLLYGALVEIGIGNVPTQINQISLVRQVLGLLRPILGEGDGALTRAALTSTLGTPAIVAVLAGFCAVMIAFSAVLFATREFAGPGVREP